MSATHDPATCLVCRVADAVVARELTLPLITEWEHRGAVAWRTCRDPWSLAKLAALATPGDALPACVFVLVASFVDLAGGVASSWYVRSRVWKLAHRVSPLRTSAWTTTYVSAAATCHRASRGVVNGPAAAALLGLSISPPDAAAVLAAARRPRV